MRQNHTLRLGLLELFQNDAELFGKFKFWKSLSGSKNLATCDDWFWYDHPDNLWYKLAFAFGL